MGLSYSSTYESHPSLSSQGNAVPGIYIDDGTLVSSILQLALLLFEGVSPRVLELLVSELAPVVSLPELELGFESVIL